MPKDFQVRDPDQSNHICRNHSSFEKGPTAATVKNKLSPRIALFVDDNDCDDGLQSSDYTFGENVKVKFSCECEGIDKE